MTEAKTEHTLELIEAARLLKFKAATGWPQTFAHDKLAVLQTWRKGIERKDWFKEAATWQELLRLVVESDAIEHTTTTERVQTTPPIRRTVNPGYGSREWTERDFAGAQVESRSFLGGTLVTGYIQPAKYKDVTRHHITAPAFAAWLAEQGKEPAPLVAAWFKAWGVGTVPAGEATNKRNARWLLIWDTQSPKHEAGSQARAIAAIVAAEDVTEAVAKKGLQNAKKARAEMYRDDGVLPINPGKNTADNPFNSVKERASKNR